MAIRYSDKSATHRRTLVRNINQLFGRRGIEATAARLTPLSARADFLDISHSLGVLEPFAGDNVRGYRQSLSIPGHIQRFMTLAYRTALIERIPMKLDIVSGPSDSVQLDVGEQQISLTLIRTQLPSGGGARRPSRARRKSD